MADSYIKRKAKFGSVVLHSFHVRARSYAHLMGFGERLAKARKLLGMTQTDLGRGLGTDGADVGKQVVYGWEKDQHYPRVDQLMLICRKLSVSADYLLFGDDARAVSPRYKAAQAALSQLSDEERLALFTAITQPALADHEVEAKIPATKDLKAASAALDRAARVEKHARTK